MTEQQPTGGAQAPPSSNMAIISLIAGILGISLFPFIGSIVAVITGQMARREIRDSAGTLGGEGLSTAGLVLGWVGIALGVLGLCIGVGFIVVPFCIAIFAGASGEFSALPLLLALL